MPITFQYSFYYHIPAPIPVFKNATLGKEGRFIAVVPKLRSVDLKASTTRSHGIRFISVMAALECNKSLI
jgi:hypothetical protein